MIKFFLFVLILPSLLSLWWAAGFAWYLAVDRYDWLKERDEFFPGEEWLLGPFMLWLAYMIGRQNRKLHKG